MRLLRRSLKLTPRNDGLKKLAILVALAVFLLPSIAFADARTNACVAGRKSEAEVGPFLRDICIECYNQGNCAINDILQVINNIGIFLLEISAVILFALYVYGGALWLLSGGNVNWVSKGKKVLTQSTVGLLIVFAAFALVKTFEALVLTGNIATEQSVYTVCGGTSASEGQPCGPAKICVSSSCVDICVAQGPAPTSTDGQLQYYICMDSAAQASSTSIGSTVSCSSGEGVCPNADAGVQCCQITANP